MRESLVYCAGPITGTTFDESNAWRVYVASKFPEHIKAVSPMRGRGYLEGQKDIKDAYPDQALGSQKGTVCRDRFDTERCDLLLVNFLGATRVSIGSVMEVAWADAYRKPIILVMDSNDQLHRHTSLLEVAGFVVPTLDEAIQVAIAVLSPTL